MSPRTRHSASGPVDRLISRVTARWRSETEILHRRGADEQAAVLESCASELQDEGRLFSLESLSLGQAEAESGFSYSALQKMVSEGTIPNVGKKGAPRVRRGDLPKKPGADKEANHGEPTLATRVLVGRSIVSHIP
jgi:hypothetical protein